MDYSVMEKRLVEDCPMGDYIMRQCQMIPRQVIPWYVIPWDTILLTPTPYRIMQY